MFRSSQRRLVGGAAALMLLGATFLSMTGVALASPPRWEMHVQPLPDKVTPGADAGYKVTITNNGPSNISQLFLVNDAVHKGNPTYVDDSIATGGRLACTDENVKLLCSFGALNAGESVTVIVGFTTSGTGSFDPSLEANSNGVSFQDPKRSHGDTLIDPTFTGTILSTDKNFGGGFTINVNGSVGNNNNLNGQNKQSTTVTHLPAGVQATVEDGPTTTGSCTPDGTVTCTTFIGEWSVLTIQGGFDFTPDYFVAKIHYSGGSKPNAFVHSYGNNLQEDLLPCAGGVFDGTTPCFTWDAGTHTATLYLHHNGSVRGL